MADIVTFTKICGEQEHSFTIITLVLVIDVEQTPLATVKNQSSKELVPMPITKPFLDYQLHPWKFLFLNTNMLGADMRSKGNQNWILSRGWLKVSFQGDNGSEFHFTKSDTKRRTLFQFKS